MYLPPEVCRVLERLTQAGHESYAVGGCVRDQLLGRPVHDYDVTTSALPEQTEALFCGQVVTRAGLKHGTLTIREGEMPIEVTTFRTEGSYSDGRRPDFVRFGCSLREDLARRDFTVNAMAYSPRTGLVYPFGGQSDLAAGTVRAVGDPAERFSEDALRILRALRFASVLGWQVEDRTARAALECRGQLDHIARERIRDEFLQLLCGPGAAEVLRRFYPVVGTFLPQLLPAVGFEQHNPHHLYDVFEHTLHSVQAIAPDPILRLCMLLHDLGKPACFTRDAAGVGHFYGHAQESTRIARQVVTHLKLSRADAQTVVTLVELHDVTFPPTERVIRRWLGRLGEERLRMLLAIKRADYHAQAMELSDRGTQLDLAEAVLERVLREGQCFSLRQLAVDGRDLIALGFAPGPGLGQALSQLLDAVLEGRCPNEPDALLALARQLPGYPGACPPQP